LRYFIWADKENTPQGNRILGPSEGYTSIAKVNAAKAAKAAAKSTPNGADGKKRKEPTVCRCGSELHTRTTHGDCSLNKRTTTNTRSQPVASTHKTAAKVGNTGSGATGTADDVLLSPTQVTTLQKQLLRNTEAMEALMQSQTFRGSVSDDDDHDN
jgi:hypothetical protein